MFWIKNKKIRYTPANLYKSGVYGAIQFHGHVLLVKVLNCKIGIRKDVRPLLGEVVQFINNLDC